MSHASFSHLPLSVFEGCLARKLHFHIFSCPFLRDVSHENFVFISSAFRSNNSFRKHLNPSEPCHVLRLLAAHLGRATCAKKNIFSASNGPAPSRQGSCDVLAILSLSFGLSFGRPGWIKKICETMILGNPPRENS